MAAFIFNETPWFLSGYFICTAETIRMVDCCPFMTLSYHQPALANSILKLSGSTVDSTAHNYIWIRSALKRNRNIHYCAVKCSAPTTDTNTHGRDCGVQKVTGVTVKRKRMIYLDREEVRNLWVCIGMKRWWYLRRGDFAGKDEYNEAIQWMYGHWDWCDLRFGRMDWNGGGLCRMSIPLCFVRYNGQKGIDPNSCFIYLSHCNVSRGRRWWNLDCSGPYSLGVMLDFLPDFLDQFNSNLKISPRFEYLKNWN